MIKVFAVLALLVALEAKAEPKHGLSLFGDLKYQAGFKQFGYVNINAPKGGRIALSAIGGFDSLNPFIIKGRPAQQLGLIYDTLMTPSFDEPASAYGLIARNVEIKNKQVIFHLRPSARFHDGKPITADDVIWTFHQLRKAHPFYQAYYHDVARVEKSSPHQVRFHLQDGTNKELPFILGQLPVLPKHYWSRRDFTATTLEPPLGSGPYRIVKVEAGRAITYRRVKNYWGRALAVNRGQHNIDELRIEYFGDASVAFEAFKAGQIGFYLENSAKNWAVGYQAIKDNPRLVKETIEDKNPAGMQAFVFNIRREKFANPKLREAFNYAFDFEWMNRHFFYNAYRRTASYFEGSELAAPRACLAPQTKGDGQNRAQLRRAAQLLDAAGWEIKDQRRVNRASGEALSVEFLLVSPAFEKIVLAYQRQLEKLGIAVQLRLVDAAQYRNRLRDYDFDIIIHNFPQSLSPGNEQRDFWGSQSAKLAGGRNLIGIQSASIDRLINNVIAAQNRKNLIQAVRALDRALCAGHYVVPQWHLPYYRLAYWRPLAHPRQLPPYSLGFPQMWWVAP